jgi:regulator of RNase E activity RraA
MAERPQIIDPIPPVAPQHTHNLRMDPRTRELLSRTSTATITTQLLARGLRNTFLHGIKPLNPGNARLVGPAFTLRYIPAREDIDVLAVFKDYDHPQRKAIESVPPGHVLVMDCRGQTRAASAGNILATRLQVRGGAGIVTDGTLRDTPEIRNLRMPAFSQGASPLTNLAQHHAVDMQIPIGCAGVPVYPGDIIVGDEEGVVCIPAHLADEIAEPAAAQEDLERWILKEIESGKPLKGTYPPDEDTLRRAAHRAT